MTAGEATLNYVIAAAPDLQARLVEQLSPTKAHFEMIVELLDSSSKVYQLIVEANEKDLRVKECHPEHLPAFCPQRHINVNGTFCLGWGVEQDLNVTCEDTARSWWSLLHRFLGLQVRAVNKKAWPSDEWAHGEAAIFQRSAEHAAKALGREYFNWLKQGKLRVVVKQKGGSKGPLLKLYLGPRHLCSVWKGHDKVANKRQPCICKPLPHKKIKRMRSCTDHAYQIRTLITAIHDQDTALEAFWKRFQGKPCCGTIKNCPLGSGAHASNNDGNDPNR